MELMRCIKKKGIYLSSQSIVYNDRWEPSAIDAQYTTSYTLVRDQNYKMTLIDRVSVQSYLAKKHGEFLARY
jgi:hypothetical protein